MDHDDSRAVAWWRVAVRGPLISARLEHGQRCALCGEAAARTPQRPDGRWVRLAARTIEAWYYAYRRGGLEALRPPRRHDRGTSRAIAPQLAELVVRAKREQPRRSIRRIIRMLERAGVVRRGELSRSSVHRLRLAKGISGRPGRGPAAERRSFMAEPAGDLWVGDVMHGPLVLAPAGVVRKSYLISQLDHATRFVLHRYCALSEAAVEHEDGCQQALLKHGCPRSYYVDLGAAYPASSLREITAELGIPLLHPQPRDGEAKGIIERWHRTGRDEVGDELPEAPLPLAELNRFHWAWLANEYHRRVHATTGRAPLEHWLDEAAQRRPLPAGKELDAVFLHREKRTVRKDATGRCAGRFYEVRAELTGKRVERRCDPRQPHAVPPRVFLDDDFVGDRVALDRGRNHGRHRRRQLGTPDPTSPPTGLDPLALIARQHYQRTRLPGQEPTHKAPDAEP